MLIIVITGILFTYLLSATLGHKFKFNSRVTKILRIVQLIALLTLIVVFALSQYDIYLRGYWVPRIIFWAWFFLVMLLYAFGNRTKVHGVEQKIYKILFFLPLIFPLIVLIPFIGAALLLRFHVLLIGDNSMIVYSSDKIRIERPFIRFMSPDPPIEIYTKHKLFSHKDTVIDIMYNEKLDSLKVEEFSSDSIKIIYFNNTDTFNGGPVQEFWVRVKEH